MSLKSIFHSYFAGLYQDTMSRTYQEAQERIAKCLPPEGYCLDCGAGSGHQLQALQSKTDLHLKNYIGIEWNEHSVSLAKKKGLQVHRADLNQNLPFADETFHCVFGLSVLEHLINGCKFMQEAYRVLKPNGHLILVTPNLSTWFNIFLLGIGKMPSSGPHPDSTTLLRWNTPIRFRDTGVSTLEETTPMDRHLVVFTYRTLLYYLKTLGFRKVEGMAYGLYPFPRFLQPLLEKLDPWHCHQMLFDCKR